MCRERNQCKQGCLNTAETLGIAFTDAWAWNVDLTSDGVHFSPEGHASFAAGLAEALDNL